MSETPVAELERRVAEFFGAPYAVAVDSCTHGIELCLRHLQAKTMLVPKRTYLSVPMLAKKLNLELIWDSNSWEDYYYITENVLDAAVLWKRDSYIPDTFMCLSFQYQKHLSLGRGGMILVPTKKDRDALAHMVYDGRTPDIPWREQNISTMGYHYYMTPETAVEGLKKIDRTINTKPRQWTYTDWPDLTMMDFFRKEFP